jgi:hypothetical protein
VPSGRSGSLPRRIWVPSESPIAHRGYDAMRVPSVFCFLLVRMLGQRTTMTMAQHLA